jgi:hypothetical protein
MEEKELTAAEYSYSTKIGVVIGFLVGWAVGIAILMYGDSPRFNQIPGVESIPLWFGFGWGIYGFIVGGGGNFAHLGRKTKTSRIPARAMAAHRAA